ncbi:hypothetical protein [Lachnoclostridium sp.]|uniref:hypothetical protein n=1 Tax=Lachnoclostridium sp. TaxID=2028282 RepID=UPI0028A23B5C|nr:hypothetical protein [Lachnoclostridium sp.]
MSIAIGKVRIANTDDGSKKYEFLTTNGTGDYYLADDGYYYKIDNVGINDNLPNTKETYSSEMIEERLRSSIDSLVLPTQNDAPTVWQKTFLNVKAGDILEMTTSDSYKMDKAFTQVYKHINGQTNKTDILHNFSIDEIGQFFYDEDNVVLSNEDGGIMKIKDSFQISNILNQDGYYESELISKNDFIDFYSITVEGRL